MIESVENLSKWSNDNVSELKLRVQQLEKQVQQFSQRHGDQNLARNINLQNNGEDLNSEDPTKIIPVLNTAFEIEGNQKSVL